MRADSLSAAARAVRLGGVLDQLQAAISSQFAIPVDLGRLAVQMDRQNGACLGVIAAAMPSGVML